MPGIIEELDLDYSAALAGAEELGAAIDASLTGAIDSFTSNMSAALADVVSNAPSIDLTANTDEATTQIETLTSSTTAASDQLSLFASDTADATAGLTDMGTAAVDAASSVDGLDANLVGATDAAAGVGAVTQTATSNTKNMADSVGVLAGAAALGSGELGGAGEAVEGFGAKAVGGFAGAAALAGGIVELAHAGIEGAAAQQRYNTVLGQFAAQVNLVKVGNLNTTLKDLSLQMGTLPSKTQQTAASIFSLGTNAGRTGAQSADFTSKVIALAARAVALKPSLGDVADVADTMSRRMGTASARTLQYGLSLNNGQIQAEAMKETHKNLTAELTPYEKAVAAANLATARYGGTLQTTIDEGSKNAIIQQRGLKASFQDMIEELGKPLVAPLFALIRQGIPLVAALGQILAELGGDALPLVAGAAGVVGPALKALASVLHDLEPEVKGAVAGFLAFEVVSTLGPLFIGFGTALLGAAASMGLLGEEAATSAAEVAALGAEVDAEEASLGPVGWLAIGIGAVAGALGLFSNNASDAAAHMKQLSGETTGSLVKSFNDGVTAIKNLGIGEGAASLTAFKSVVDANVGTAQRLYDALVKNGTATAAQKKILDGAIQSQKQVNADQKTGTQVTAQQTTAFASATQAASDYKTALDNLDAGQSSLFDDQTKSAKAIQTLFAAWVAAKGSIDAGTKAGQDNRDALVGAASAARTQADALRLTGVSALEASKPITDLANSIVYMGLRSNETPVQIAGLLSSLGLIPPLSAASITTADQLSAAIAGIGPAAAGIAPPIAAAAPAVAGAMGAVNAQVDIGAAQLAATAAGAGTVSGQQLAQGFSSQAPQVAQGIDLANTTIGGGGFILNATAQTAGYGAGLNLALGLRNGIAAGGEGVTAAAVKLINDAKAAANTAAQSKSPSRLFAVIGQNLSAGMAVGMREGAPLVVRESKTIIQSAAAPVAGVAPAATQIVPQGAPSGPTIGTMNLYGVDAQTQAHRVIREANIARANA